MINIMNGNNCVFIAAMGVDTGLGRGRDGGLAPTK